MDEEGRENERRGALSQSSDGYVLFRQGPAGGRDQSSSQDYYAEVTGCGSLELEGEIQLVFWVESESRELWGSPHGPVQVLGAPLGCLPTSFWALTWSLTVTLLPLVPVHLPSITVESIHLLTYRF